MVEINNKISQDVCDFIDNIRDEIIEFTLDCIKQSSETASGDESALAELIIKKTKTWRFDKPEILSKKKNRPNIIFNFKGSKKGKKLILSGHLDTVPFGDPKDWKIIDPKNPVIIGGKLYGRGASDMKSSLVSMLAAAYAIKAIKVPFKGSLALMFTADEENECECGAQYLTEVGFSADAIICGEPSGQLKSLDTIGIASRGDLLGKVITYGTEMHTSVSDNAGCVNASVKMAKVLLEFANNLKKNLHFNPQKLYPLGPTITPGVILEGGGFFNVVPGSAAFGFDIRVTPGMKFGTLKKDLENFLKKLEKDDKELKCELVIEKLPFNTWFPPAEIEENHPVVLSCISAAKEILGFEPIKIGVPFGSESIFYVNKLGIPSISSFGPGFIKLAHGPDEYVEVQSIIDAAKIYALAALKYLNDF